jgi:hypothetical protein
VKYGRICLADVSKELAAYICKEMETVYSPETLITTAFNNKIASK